MATYVLVHGGWDGGWAWRGVARALRASGDEVFTPTLTGSGERVHLASPEVGLDTHIEDVANVLRYEALREVVLVGLSYGGMVITGVAERAPERIRQLVYLDAFAPRDGESAADLLGPDLASAFEQVAQARGEGWFVPHDPPDADRRTPLLLKPAKQPLRLGNPEAARIGRSYVLFTGKPPGDWLGPVFARIAARAREEGWHYQEAPFDHFPLLERPAEVAALLRGLGPAGDGPV